MSKAVGVARRLRAIPAFRDMADAEFLDVVAGYGAAIIRGRQRILGILLHTCGVTSLTSLIETRNGYARLPRTFELTTVSTAAQRQELKNSLSESDKAAREDVFNTVFAQMAVNELANMGFLTSTACVLGGADAAKKDFIDSINFLLNKLSGDPPVEARARFSLLICTLEVAPARKPKPSGRRSCKRQTFLKAVTENFKCKLKDFKSEASKSEVEALKRALKAKSDEFDQLKEELDELKSAIAHQAFGGQQNLTDDNKLAVQNAQILLLNREVAVLKAERVKADERQLEMLTQIMKLKDIAQSKDRRERDPNKLVDTVMRALDKLMQV
ncbi:hypothetical protein HK101_006962 [Irineochytrium annulatum]|nr:hypothetical protein HK101_006962 [Irineochytrium annulatum]